MKVKTIPIMLLLLFSMATPVVVSMAIPKNAKTFRVVADMDPYLFLSIGKRGVQKYSQSGDLLNYTTSDPIGTIDMNVSITNFYKAYNDSKYARAIVHFIMYFDAEGRTDIRGIIVGKIWIDDEGQHADGIFVGRGSHVKGKISYRDPETPDVLLFDGKEW